MARGPRCSQARVNVDSSDTEITSHLKTVVLAKAGTHAQCAAVRLARLWWRRVGPRLRGDDRAWANVRTPTA